MASGKEPTTSAEPVKTVIIPDPVTVRDLAELLGQSVSDVIGKLIKNGVMATINDQLDHDTASIIAAEFDITVGDNTEDSAKDGVPAKRIKNQSGETRPPVVAVMGHVDHGKTSLLDAMRGSNTTDREAGGITQHISAYHLKHKGRELTLLDTPGHEAFVSLRQHGAALTDVAVIVVAADDGVKPQTKEAIDFVRQAGVQIVVAINKIDKAGADANKTKQELAQLGLNPEEWGGDTVIVEVSAKTKKGIDQLLDMVLLVADINELKAPVDVPAEGIIIESHMAVGKGPLATLLIEQGILRPQDYVVAGSTYAKIRSLEDESGQKILSAGPSRAVTISGFKTVPSFGDRFEAVATEKEARQRSNQQGLEDRAAQSTVKTLRSAEDVLQSTSAQATSQDLNLILKADVRGSLEAITGSLEALGNDEVSVNVVSADVGNINESDVARAGSSDAAILGFHVSVSSTIKRIAARDNVTIKLYSVIYELIDEVRTMLEGLLSPEIIESTVGSMTVKGIFHTTRSQLICGGEVKDGKIQPQLLARVHHGKQLLGEATVTKVQKGQQEAKEVVAGEMCGVELSTSQKLLVVEGDTIEFFTRESKRRSLA